MGTKTEYGIGWCLFQVVFFQDDDRYVDGSDNSCLRKNLHWRIFVDPICSIRLEYCESTFWLNFIRSMYGVNIPGPWSCFYGPGDPMTF